MLLNADFNAAAAEVTARATDSGTFLVVAADGSNGVNGIGNYRISLAKTGEPLVISVGDEGGLMTGAGAYDGIIDTGDLDAWAFTACAGDILSINAVELVGNSTLFPWVRLYGRDGVLLKTVFGAATAGFENFVAPASGTYTLVVSDGSGAFNGTGTYRLTVNGLSAGMKLCPLTISGLTVNAVGIGGTPGAPFTLLTTTDLATPLANWTPLVSDQFDQFGVFSHPSSFDAIEPQRFFLIRLP